MPRVTHVKKARKDVPGTDIKAGEPYYWWKFRHGGKRTSRTYPKPWDLTQSSFLQQLYQLQYQIEKLTADADTLGDTVEEIAGDIRTLGEECQESRDNMPESLQDAPTGELLGERVDAMEAWADELECIDFGPDYDEELADQDEPEEDDESEGAEAIREAKEEREQFWDSKLEEVQGIDCGL